jgi:cation diffusion facilitator CzcD-associated flavoprotein CzcO
VNPRVMQLAARMGRAHINRQIADPALRAKVTPSYTPGCKRILMADDYYPTLARDNVELHTEALTGVTERGVMTAGGERAVDAIIFGTGFRVSDLLTPMQVIGRGGVDLNEQWQTTGIEAYLGTTIAGFPNLYTLMGPNTGLGHNSMVFMIEAQVHYVMACLRAQERRGAQLADVRARAQAAFNASLQPRLSRAVWASGCSSWYLDAHGKNATIWPGFTFEYWWRTRQVRAQDYDFTRETDTSALGPKAPIERSNQATAGLFSGRAAHVTS